MAADGYAGFETEDTSEFDVETDVDGDLNATEAAKHDGSWGAEFTFDDANAAYGTMNADAIDQTSGVVSFWINTNSFALDDGKQVNLGHVDDGAAAVNYYIQLFNDGGTYKLATAYVDDADVYQTSGTKYAITDAWHHYLLLFEVSSAPAADDGWLAWYIDGVLQEHTTGHDNDTQDWDFLQVGMCWTNSVGFGGSFYMDEIYVDPTERHWCYLSAGTVTPAGTAFKGIGKPSLAGTVTPAGVLSRVVAWYRSLAGTLTPAGTVSKGLFLSLAGVLAPAGSIIKGAGKVLAGTITPAGRLIQRIANFFRIWFDGSPETVARIDITATADTQLDASPETTVILEQ